MHIFKFQAIKVKCEGKMCVYAVKKCEQLLTISEVSSATVSLGNILTKKHDSAVYCGNIL